MRDSEQTCTIAGGGVLDVYCETLRLKRTGTTRGSGKVCFHIFMRSSKGSWVKSSKVSGESILDRIRSGCLGSKFSMFVNGVPLLMRRGDLGSDCGCKNKATQPCQNKASRNGNYLYPLHHL